jgi:hypothetical protein
MVKEGVMIGMKHGANLFCLGGPREGEALEHDALPDT